MPASQKKKTPSVTRIRARDSSTFRWMDFDQLVVEQARAAVGFKRYVRELWERRHLVRVLSGRQLKSTYEMNIVGFAWWLLEPLSLTLVYVVIVQFIFKRGTPAYPLFVLVALLPFKWLQSAVIGSMGTVRGNASLVTDVYFPRALLPMGEVVTHLAHFGVGLLVVPIFMALYGVAPSWHLVFLPVAIAVQFVFVLGLAYPASVWGLYYRNLPGLMTNLLRLWFYLSPAIWSLDRIGTPWKKTIIRLNPLTGLFETYRGAILTHKPPSWDLIYTAALGVIGLLLGGWYFTRREPSFGKLL